MAGSVKDSYAIRYVRGGRSTSSGATTGGGNALLSTDAHKLDGAEHTLADDTTRLDATSTRHGLLPKLSGSAGDVLRGDGAWATLNAAAVPVVDAGGYFTGTEVEAVLAELGPPRDHGSLAGLADDDHPQYAPSSADYLVGSANSGLSAEIVVGTTPGGELGGTWASPTVDATHSGSAHHTQSHDHSAAGDGTALAPATVAISSTGSSALTIGGDTSLYRSASAVLGSDSHIRLVPPNATTPKGFTILVAGEAQNRVTLDMSAAGVGRLLLGDGTSAPDVTLYRSAANVLSLATGDALAVNGVQVITARRTGWGAPTGTATRTTFATTTVTLAQLAERVKALIDDLTTHGLIGA